MISQADTSVKTVLGCLGGEQYACPFAWLVAAEITSWITRPWRNLLPVFKGGVIQSYGELVGQVRAETLGYYIMWPNDETSKLGGSRHTDEKIGI